MPICPKIMQHCILWSTLMIFFKYCSIVMGHLKLTSLTSLNFLKKSLLRLNGWFMSNLAQNCNILYLVICLTVRILLRHCGIKGYGRWTIVVLVNFPKKSPFLAKGQFVSNFAQKFSALHFMICHRVVVFWNILA